MAIPPPPPPRPFLDDHYERGYQDGLDGISYEYGKNYPADYLAGHDDGTGELALAMTEKWVSDD